MNLNFPFHAPGFYHSIVYIHVGLLSIKGMGNFTVELPDLTLPVVHVQLIIIISREFSIAVNVPLST